jgi:hypothetical protein
MIPAASGMIRGTAVTEAVMGEITAEKGIRWRHDFDAALTDAKSQSRDVLLDFSAAPM